MRSASEKLAESLAALQRLRKDGSRVFRSRQFTRLDRERLLRGGFLQEATHGWLISSVPGVGAGDTTSLFASFWEFCAKYCESRFGAAWCLSPEQSLLLHGEHSVVPKQVIIHSPRGSNNKIALPFESSLYDLKQARMPARHELTVREGLRLFSIPSGLRRVSETFFRVNPVEARICLENVRDASDVLSGLLDEGRSTVAGRLAGAFRYVHRPGMANEILKTMKSAGYDVRETNPFAEPSAAPAVTGVSSPIAARLRGLWEMARPVVLTAFPKPPGLPRDHKAFTRSVEEVYQTDAFNSLSMEGYNVTPALVERVRSGKWNRTGEEADRRQRDALAARGYWQAFQVVKADVARIVRGANPGALVRENHRDWYRELFAPCAVAGLIDGADLAGYRNNAVYLRNCRHVPPRWESVRDAMPALFDLIEAETSSAVRAVVGHWLFGYIHPYPDGNGRIARFLMNTLLASGGYSWTVIRVEDRARYLAALDTASVDLDIRPFTAFIADCVKRRRGAGRAKSLKP